MLIISQFVLFLTLFMVLSKNKSGSVDINYHDYENRNSFLHPDGFKDVKVGIAKRK